MNDQLHALSENFVIQNIAARLAMNPNRVQNANAQSSTEFTCLLNSYHNARLCYLQMHDWDFATKTETLTYDEIRKGYILPPDCIRVICIGGKKSGWRTEGRTIIFGESYCTCGPVCSCVNTCCPVTIRYVYDMRVPNNMSPMFRKAVEAQAAADSAMAILGNPLIKIREQADADKFFKMARDMQNHQGGGIRVTGLPYRGRGCYGC